jgi:hypothetical protein
MKTWFFWAGISFIIGGIISLALNLGVQGSLSMLEDLTGYAIGWMAVGTHEKTIYFSRSRGENL